MSHPRTFLLLLPLLLSAGACDQIAVLDGTKAREADALAVGSACRQSGRALEDCFVMYPDSPKAQVFAGWKEMNDYMTSNKIEVVVPSLVKAEAKAETKPEKGGGNDAKPAGSDKVVSRPMGLSGVFAGMLCRSRLCFRVSFRGALSPVRCASVCALSRKATRL